MTEYLTEAFKAMEDLEDTFSFDEVGAEELKKFKDGDVEEDSVEVIDVEASNPEELKDSYEGKIILGCNTCLSLIYKDEADVVIDEESGDANMEEECPYCKSKLGWKVIGQVSEIDEEELEDDDSEDESHAKEIEDEFDDIEEVEEESKELKEDWSEESKSIADYIEDRFKDSKSITFDEYTDAFSNACDKFGANCEDSDLDTDVRTILSLSGWSTQFEGENEGGLLKENFERVEIETDKETMSMESSENGGVTVTTTPKEEVEEHSEVIKPLSDENKEDIIDNSVEDLPEEEEEVVIDEFDEEEFDGLEEQYLKRVYENVKSYKTVSGSVEGNTLKLEGIISFNSGKSAKTNFIFESHSKTKTGKLKFIGENTQFANKKNAFVLTGRANGSKLCIESLTYNYNAKDAKTGKSSKLYGTVKSKKA